MRGTAISVNNLVTAMLAFGAIVVSVVALWINRQVDRRATRSVLTGLALTVSKQVSDYEKLGDDRQELFRRKLDIEVMVNQADSLMQQLGKLCPDSAAVTLAQALEAVQDYWWADQYWKQASHARGPYRRAITIGYWGMALFFRGDQTRARLKTHEAVHFLVMQSTDAYLVRGHIYLAMGALDMASASDWFELARREFSKIPNGDDQRSACFEFVDTHEAKVRLNQPHAP